ncbi:MAG: lipid-A-disaccharide synthase, partial [Pseudohongiellaceae bacterium]
DQIQTLLDTQFPDLPIKLVTGNSRSVMAASDLLLVASGTVTLEALLLKKPMIVCYRMGRISYGIISRMLKVPYFSLPNLLAQEKLVPELVQDDVSPQTLVAEINHLWHDPGKLTAQIERFASIHQSLRQNANRRAATAVLELVCKKDS